MNNPLLRKLSNFTELSEEECNAVEECCRNVREVGAREDVIAQGDRTGGVKLLLEGFACRYKTLEDGRRQIVSYFVPGDLCDLLGLHLEAHGSFDRRHCPVPRWRPSLPTMC